MHACMAALFSVNVFALAFFQAYVGSWVFEVILGVQVGAQATMPALGAWQAMVAGDTSSSRSRLPPSSLALLPEEPCACQS